MRRVPDELTRRCILSQKLESSSKQLSTAVGKECLLVRHRVGVGTRKNRIEELCGWLVPVRRNVMRNEFRADVQAASTRNKQIRASTSPLELAKIALMGAGSYEGLEGSFDKKLEAREGFRRCRTGRKGHFTRQPPDCSDLWSCCYLAFVGEVAEVHKPPTAGALSRTEQD